MIDIRKAGYRLYQAGFSVGTRVLPWRSPVTFTGANDSEKIPELLKCCGVHRVMVISGRHTGKTLVPPLREKIAEAGIDSVHFSEVSANPTVAVVEEIREMYLREGCDGFLAVGGGSPIDAAKAAAARIVRPGKSVEQLSGLLKVGKELPPFIAVPTTAGSGSETTMAAVITNEENHHKHAVMDLCLVPKFAVLDPVLTVGLPPMTTACCGMDALTHALEAYLCLWYNTKRTLAMEEKSAVAIFQYLERAVSDGADLEAREAMLTASYQAGWSFTRAGVGYVHAIAHTVGGLYNVAHGLANAVILPIVLEDYGAAVWPKLAHMAELTGVKTDGTEEEKAKAFISEIRAMNRRMGIPEQLDMIRSEDIPRMIGWALKEANPTYPVPVIYDEERCRRVIERVRGN